MTTRALTLLVAMLALLAAGCGGSGDAGGEAGGGGGGGDCETATSELVATVSERDRLFVDLRLDEAAKACAGQHEPGTEAACAEARADLADAAAAEAPPGDVEQRVSSAVEACAGVAISSTLPAP